MTAVRLAAAALLAVLIAAPPHPAKAEENTMYAVMVEFDVAAEQTEAVLSTVEGLLMDLVRHQDGFLQARLHRQAEGAKVINHMLWRDADAFKAFRAEHQDRIGQAIGPFGPKFSFYSRERSFMARITFKGIRRRTSTMQEYQKSTTAFRQAGPAQSLFARCTRKCGRRNPVPAPFAAWG